MNTAKIVSLVCSFLGVFAIGIGIGNLQQTKKLDQYIQNSEQLEATIDSLVREIDILSENAFLLEHKRDSLYNVIDIQVQNLDKLKKDYAKKINTVVRYGNSELEQFFSERYGY